MGAGSRDHYREKNSMDALLPQIPDGTALLELAQTRMPFGKYAGCRLIDLPEPYIVWFKGRGFPAGKLGRMLEVVYEIKLNGLEYLFEPLRENAHDNRKS